MDKKLREVFYSITLSILFLSVSSCTTARIGDPPKLPDPEFNGRWVDDDIIMLVGHTRNAGLLDGVVLNNNPGGVWDSISFTGRVSKIQSETESRAEVLFQIWGTGDQGNAIMIAEFSSDLVRTGNVIILNLAPLQENYELQKQP